MTIKFFWYTISYIYYIQLCIQFINLSRDCAAVQHTWLLYTCYTPDCPYFYFSLHTYRLLNLFFQWNKFLNNSSANHSIAFKLTEMFNKIIFNVHTKSKHIKSASFNTIYIVLCSCRWTWPNSKKIHYLSAF